MLKGKTGFKPKAKPSAIRRPAPISKPQSVASPPTETLVSSTPASTPSVVDSQEQSQPPQHPPPPPSDVVIHADSPAAGTNAISTSVETSSQPNTQDEPAAVAPLTPVPTTPSASAPAATQDVAPAVDVEPAIQTSTPPITQPPSDTQKASSLKKPATEIRSAAKPRLRGSRTPLPTSARAQVIPIPSSEPQETPATSSEPPTISDLTNESDLSPRQVPEEVAPSIETEPSAEVETSVENSVDLSSSGPSEASNHQKRRKCTADEATGGTATESSTPAPPKKRARKRVALLPGEEGYEQARAAAPKTTRAQKRTRATTENGEGEGAGEVEGEGEGSEASGIRRKRRTPRVQREATPENAENVEVDVNEVKMADLAKDMHIGKKFSLHDELMARERAKRLRYNEKRKRARAGLSEDAVEENEEGPAVSAAPNAGPSGTVSTDRDDETVAAGPSRVVAPVGEQYQIIDGEIVLNVDSLAVDRHARAREIEGQLIEVEENDFTHHTTSQTYLRRALKPGQWSDEDTEQFYWALSRFGTDFETISRMFPDKTRKHIKLKFNREERANPTRINAALVGQKTEPMSIEEYKQRTKQEYEPAQAIYDEHERREKEFEERQKAAEEEKAEEARKKKEEILAQLNSGVDANGKKRRGGRKKKIMEASL